ncbi:MAG: C-terminal binding protein [Bulleidia sp.]|nr:C-terminal binding protein [Bulleidia sp.]
MKAVVVDKDYGSVKPDEVEVVKEAYAKAGIELVAAHYTSEDEIIAGCKGAEAILCTGNPPITRKVMEALPELKYIQRFGIGVNSIDLDAAAELDKIVLNIPGFCAKELGDVATAFIIGLLRNTVYYDREIRKGNWPKCTYLMPLDLRTLTLGLYGFGAAGQELYKTVHGGWGTKVIACDPYLPDFVKAQYPDVTFVDFDTMVKESDIISIHVGLTPETKHIFNKETFKKMKNNALIINTARGPIIDQKDLAWALETGEIRGAGLDTVEKEPIDKDDPLLTLDNVILSAHCGSYGVGAKKTQIETVCRLIPQAVTEKKLPKRNVADKKVLDKLTAFELY